MVSPVIGRVPAANLRAIVVDDEPLAREWICSLLRENRDVEVVAECADGDEAIREIDSLEPDLVFLDVQMRGIDGFGVVEAIGAERMPATIFVTAYDDFAIRAFDAGAVDYLLKPVEQERFATALARARSRVNARDVGSGAASLLAALASYRSDQVGVAALPDRLVIPNRGGLAFVAVTDIDRIEADGNYARVFAGAKSWLLRETMHRLEARLARGTFLRIHRSVIINVSRVHALKPLPNGDYRVTLTGGTTVLASRTYRERLHVALGLTP